MPTCGTRTRGDTGPTGNCRSACTFYFSGRTGTNPFYIAELWVCRILTQRVRFRDSREVDVCIIRANDADRCRQDPDDPPAASLVAGWECKFYAGNLQKGLGRSFVGLMDDMGSNPRLSGHVLEFCASAVARILSTTASALSSFPTYTSPGVQRRYLCEST
jgi:hypothetical protein